MKNAINIKNNNFNNKSRLIDKESIHIYKKTKKMIVTPKPQSYFFFLHLANNNPYIFLSAKILISWMSNYSPQYSKSHLHH